MSGQMLKPGFTRKGARLRGVRPLFDVLPPKERARYLLVLLLDSVLVAVAWLLAFVLRFDGRIPPQHMEQARSFLPWLLGGTP